MDAQKPNQLIDTLSPELLLHTAGLVGRLTLPAAAQLTQPPTSVEAPYLTSPSSENLSLTGQFRIPRDPYHTYFA